MSAEEKKLKVTHRTVRLEASVPSAAQAKITRGSAAMLVCFLARVSLIILILCKMKETEKERESAE